MFEQPGSPGHVEASLQEGGSRLSRTDPETAGPSTLSRRCRWACSPVGQLSGLVFGGTCSECRVAGPSLSLPGPARPSWPSPLSSPSLQCYPSPMGSAPLSCKALSH